MFCSSTAESNFTSLICSTAVSLQFCCLANRNISSSPTVVYCGVKSGPGVAAAENIGPAGEAGAVTLCIQRQFCVWTFSSICLPPVRWGKKTHYKIKPGRGCEQLCRKLGNIVSFCCCGITRSPAPSILTMQKNALHAMYHRVKPSVSTETISIRTTSLIAAVRSDAAVLC